MKCTCGSGLEVQVLEGWCWACWPGLSEAVRKDKLTKPIKDKENAKKDDSGVD